MVENLTAESAGIEVISRTGGHVLFLRGSLGIPEVRGVYQSTISLAAKQGTVWLELSRLVRADPSVLQVLAAFHRDCVRQGRVLEATGLTAHLRQQWEAAGWSGFVAIAATGAVAL